MEEGKELVASISLRQLTVISHILYFYERHLWRDASPSPQRARQLTEMQLLLVKLPLLATARLGIFTQAEVGYMDIAIQTFIKQAKEKIPQSESRDAVIEGCEELRGYLVKTLLP